jgi:hypothetical protein
VQRPQALQAVSASGFFLSDQLDLPHTFCKLLVGIIKLLREEFNFS